MDSSSTSLLSVLRGKVLDLMREAGQFVKSDTRPARDQGEDRPVPALEGLVNW